jgi:DNA end-binding protein Ku
VDPIYYETSYYLAPEEEVSKPYSLFQSALTETGASAIAKISMHRREHTVLIRPSASGLVLHTLFYQDELHAAKRPPAPAKPKFTAKELDLAKSLVKHLAAPFKPAEFHDAYRDNVERLIEQKLSGETVTAVQRPRKAQVIDLMAALKRSLKAHAGGRGVAEETLPKRKTARKRSARRKAA